MVVKQVNSYLSLDIVHVRGKRGRRVPVLMDRDALVAVEALIKNRGQVGVSSHNIFVFAAPTRSSRKPLRGNDCLNSILEKIENLEDASRIRSTQLRKYTATVSQIADLSENDLRWLAEHLGHNLDVHREYYRLRESTVELSKVSRLLLALDEGNAVKITGKKLSEISVEGKLLSFLINVFVDGDFGFFHVNLFLQMA